MGKIGILGIIIILMATIALIGAYGLAINKLFKSRLSTKDRIVWLFVIFFFNFLGLVIFLIYHDHYLQKDLRANL
jgi:ABC-type uncharacterized transport system fused permease/ATPase subunit